MKIFVINPGSTSTKFSVSDGQAMIWNTTVHHPADELAGFNHPNEQLDYRNRAMHRAIEEAGLDISEFDAVIGRGGLLRPTPGGVYEVDEYIIHDLVHAEMEHVCNLGALLADILAKEAGCRSFIADPEVVDEFMPEARLSGLPMLERRSVFHALNGKAVARLNGNPDSIKYYAQELKENTFNLTRMNLVMRGILPDNIVARNGDTLEDDWPWFESDETKEETYEPLFVDAVVSNPPYSQRWDPQDKELDPRFEYGIAPKSKADYAFLLHDLYHLRPDGIMTIVLPHGVLFRGGEEGAIRKNLVENRHIQAIIGLPANILLRYRHPHHHPWCCGNESPRTGAERCAHSGCVQALR